MYYRLLSMLVALFAWKYGVEHCISMASRSHVHNRKGSVKALNPFEFLVSADWYHPKDGSTDAKIVILPSSNPAIVLLYVCGTGHIVDSVTRVE
jgi:hypothetical protein